MNNLPWFSSLLINASLIELSWFSVEFCFNHNCFDWFFFFESNRICSQIFSFAGSAFDSFVISIKTVFFASTFLFNSTYSSYVQFSWERTTSKVSIFCITSLLGLLIFGSSQSVWLAWATPISLRHLPLRWAFRWLLFSRIPFSVMDPSSVLPVFFWSLQRWSFGSDYLRYLLELQQVMFQHV